MILGIFNVYGDCNYLITMVTIVTAEGTCHVSVSAWFSGSKIFLVLR